MPAYYKDIIADAETNFDLSLEDTDDKAILLMRKYAHIIDKGLHRVDASPGHSKKYYSILKSLIERLEKTEYATDSTLTWARSKIIAYEHLQVEDNFIPLRGEKPTINVSIEIYATNNPELSKECLKYCKGGTGFSEFIPSFWVFTANIRGYVWPSEIFLPSVDTCLGVQNIMLGATTLGLSATILSWAQKDKNEERKIRELLHIPVHHQIIICAVMGYADIVNQTPERKNI